MKPLNGYVIVNKPIVEEKTSSGIILTGGAEASDVPSKGVVIASDSDFINVGDTIVYGKYTGHDMKHEGKEFVVIKATDIFCKL